jgi:hypothetical protein
LASDGTLSLRLPELTTGRIYRRHEVEGYFGDQQGSSDYDIVRVGFPRNLDTFSCTLEGWQDDELLLQYVLVPSETLETQRVMLESQFREVPEHEARVQIIELLLRKGGTAFPVFFQQNDRFSRVLEGNHRLVALLRLKSPVVPAFRVGYPDWFGLT